MKAISEHNQNIILLLSQGKTIKEVAKELNMKYMTVVKRVEKMKKDYSCVNTTQLVVTILSFNSD